MADFASLDLSDTALRAVEALGYDAPTPIQQQAIPQVLVGRDVIGCAQTGTGKTAAFCLPCMDLIPCGTKGCGPFMLVVTPTRELADQIAEVCSTIAGVTGHKVTSVVGGVSYSGQKAALGAGTDVLIATPGRLEDLMAQGAAQLDQVSTLVLDEADHMLDMGFLPAVNRIVDACTARRQTLLFSATIDKRVGQVAKRFLFDPVRVEVSRGGQAASTVEQFLVRISHAAKPSCLKAILAEHGAQRVIVFARTRYRTEAVAKRLRRLGYAADSIHSDRSQSQRRRALDRFATGEVGVLVATDVLARGIDVDNVDYVVNYDLPQKPEDYVHRIGRTGRAGAKGMTISLVSPENEETLRAIEKLTGKQITPMTLAGFDVEAAEEEAAARSRQLQARREKDPEVEAVVKEMAAQERKERKHAARDQEQAVAGKGKGAASSKPHKGGAPSIRKSKGRSGAGKGAGAKQAPRKGKGSGAKQGGRPGSGKRRSR